MGDLIGFQGFLNTSAPINPNEYDFVWKSDRRYWDFQLGNQIDDPCPWEYPRFWDDLGDGLTNTTLGASCRNSEFDQVHCVSFFLLELAEHGNSMEK
jgi:alpha-1,3-glucan synthase